MSWCKGESKGFWLVIGTRGHNIAQTKPIPCWFGILKHKCLYAIFSLNTDGINQKMLSNYITFHMLIVYSGAITIAIEKLDIIIIVLIDIECTFYICSTSSNHSIQSWAY